MICNFVCEKDAEPFDGENIVFEEVLSSGLSSFDWGVTSSLSN